MLLYGWVAESEHRAWEQRFNARAARGEFIRYPSPASVRGPRVHLIDAIRRIRLALRRPERLRGQA
jgi:hypothetical protein